jgi:hypothetical protein
MLSLALLMKGYIAPPSAFSAFCGVSNTRVERCLFTTPPLGASTAMVQLVAEAGLGTIGVARADTTVAAAKIVLRPATAGLAERTAALDARAMTLA